MGYNYNPNSSPIYKDRWNNYPMDPITIGILTSPSFLSGTSLRSTSISALFGVDGSFPDLNFPVLFWWDMDGSLTLEGTTPGSNIADWRCIFSYMKNGDIPACYVSLTEGHFKEPPQKKIPSWKHDKQQIRSTVFFGCHSDI